MWAVAQKLLIYTFLQALTVAYRYELNANSTIKKKLNL